MSFKWNSVKKEGNPRAYGEYLVTIDWSEYGFGRAIGILPCVPRDNKHDAWMDYGLEFDNSKFVVAWAEYTTLHEGWHYISEEGNPKEYDAYLTLSNNTNKFGATSISMNQYDPKTGIWGEITDADEDIPADNAEDIIAWRESPEPYYEDWDNSTVVDAND